MWSKLIARIVYAPPLEKIAPISHIPRYSYAKPGLHASIPVIQESVLSGKEDAVHLVYLVVPLHYHMVTAPSNWLTEDDKQHEPGCCNL